MTSNLADPADTGKKPTKHELELVRIASEVELADAAAAGTVGFMGRLLVQATLPHSRPDDNEVVRRNGNTVVHMMAPRSIGIAYGGQPRLALGYITTEAVRTGSRIVKLGHTKSELLRRLGKGTDGGKNGAATAFDKQMVRLAATSIRTFTDTAQFSEIRAPPPVITRWTRWWSPRSGLEQATLAESEVELGEEFFRAITERPVPVDMRVLMAFSKSPLTMDLYCFLTYRVSYLRQATMIPWRLLMAQFGADYSDVSNFRKKALKALRAIALFWPELRWTEDLDQDGRLQFVLHPCRPHVLRLPPRR